jgi:hypothetical protein
MIGVRYERKRGSGIATSPKGAIGPGRAGAP